MLNLRRLVLAVPVILVTALTAVSGCTKVELPDPAKVKPGYTYPMPAADRLAAATAPDSSGITPILIQGGFWPTGLRAPEPRQAWRVVFTPCERKPDDSTAGECLGYSGYSVRPSITRDMKNGPHFTAWDGSVLDVTAGRVRCQTAVAGGSLTSQGLTALIVFARTQQSAPAGTYYVPAPSPKAQRQFRCKLG